MKITARSNGSLKKQKPFKVLVCLVTLVAFLFNMVSYDFAWAIGTPSGLPGGGSDRAGGPGVVKGLNVDTFTIPEYLGQIRDSFKAKSDKVVIHIQDAHCNYAAQKRIAEIIEYLNKEHGIDTVNLEGGAKDYDLSVFTNIYDKDIREKTADYFVKEGLVNGAEYFAINNPEKTTLWGIEDTKLYIDNLNIYRDSLKNKDEVDKNINALTHILNNLKTKIYPQDLLDLDTKYSQYKAGSIEFKNYLAYLIQTAKTKFIDIKTFTNIYLLSQTLGEEENVDFRKANNQRDELIDKLTKKLSRKSLEEFVLKTVEFKSERISQKDFYAYLTKKADYAGVELKDFPDLQKYIIYISMYNAIDKTKIIEEIETLENKIKDALYQNDKQKNLDKLSKNLAILKNIFSISLTKEDYKYYIDNEQSFNASHYISFINKEAPLYKITAQLDKNITDLDHNRESIAKFYEYSFKRDGAFLKNIKFSANQKIAVVVTGGFHTENLCDIFKKQHISYISIMPTFSNCDGYQCPYFGLLAGKQNALDMRIMTLFGSSLAVADIWNKLGEDVAGKSFRELLELRIKLMAAIGDYNKVLLVRRDQDKKIIAQLAVSRELAVIEDETQDLPEIDVAPILNQAPTELATTLTTVNKAQVGTGAVASSAVAELSTVSFAGSFLHKIDALLHEPFHIIAYILMHPIASFFGPNRIKWSESVKNTLKGKFILPKAEEGNLRLAAVSIAAPVGVISLPYLAYHFINNMMILFGVDPSVAILTASIAGILLMPFAIAEYRNLNPVAEGSDMRYFIGSLTRSLNRLRPLNRRLLSSVSKEKLKRTIELDLRISELIAGINSGTPTALGEDVGTIAALSDSGVLERKDAPINFDKLIQSMQDNTADTLSTSPDALRILSESGFSIPVPAQIESIVEHITMNCISITKREYALNALKALLDVGFLKNIGPKTKSDIVKALYTTFYYNVFLRKTASEILKKLATDGLLEGVTAGREYSDPKKVSETLDLLFKQLALHNEGDAASVIEAVYASRPDIDLSIYLEKLVSDLINDESYTRGCAIESMKVLAKTGLFRDPRAYRGNPSDVIGRVVDNLSNEQGPVRQNAADALKALAMNGLLSKVDPQTIQTISGRLAEMLMDNNSFTCASAAGAIEALCNEKLTNGTHIKVDTYLFGRLQRAFDDYQYHPGSFDAPAVVIRILISGGLITTENASEYERKSLLETIIKKLSDSDSLAREDSANLVKALASTGMLKDIDTKTMLQLVKVFVDSLGVTISDTTVTRVSEALKTLITEGLLKDIGAQVLNNLCERLKDLLRGGPLHSSETYQSIAGLLRAFLDSGILKSEDMSYLIKMFVMRKEPPSITEGSRYVDIFSAFADNGLLEYIDESTLSYIIKEVEDRLTLAHLARPRNAAQILRILVKNGLIDTNAIHVSDIEYLLDHITIFDKERQLLIAQAYFERQNALSPSLNIHSHYRLIRATLAHLSNIGCLTAENVKKILLNIREGHPIYTEYTEGIVNKLTDDFRHGNRKLVLGGTDQNQPGIAFHDGGNANSNFPDFMKDLFDNLPSHKVERPAGLPQRQPGVLDNIPVFSDGYIKFSDGEELRVDSDHEHYGRTVLYRMGNKNIHLKLLKEGESPSTLAYECDMINFLNSMKEEWGLKGGYPKGRLQIGRIPAKFLPEFLEETESEGKPMRIERVGRFSPDLDLRGKGYYTFMAYETEADEKGHNSFLTYLNDPDLSHQEFMDGLKINVHDRFIMAAHGLFDLEIVELFHNQEHGAGRRYDWMVDVRHHQQHRRGAGRLNNVPGATMYPNIRLSGPADFAEVYFIDDLIESEETKQLADNRIGRLLNMFEKKDRDKALNFITAAYLGDTCLALSLMLPTYFDRRGELDYDIENSGQTTVLKEFVKILFDESYRSYTGRAPPYSGDLNINADLIARQMAYFLTDRYFRDFKAGKEIPPELYPGVSIGQIPKQEHKRGWIEGKGWDITSPPNPLHIAYNDKLKVPSRNKTKVWYATTRDAGPVNGPIPLQELIRSFYIATPLMVAGRYVSPESVWGRPGVESSAVEIKELKVGHDRETVPAAAQKIKPPGNTDPIKLMIAEGTSTPDDIIRILRSSLPEDTYETRNISDKLIEIAVNDPALLERCRVISDRMGGSVMKRFDDEFPKRPVAASTGLTAMGLTLRDAIIKSGGKITFRDFMDLSLYSDQGYYHSGTVKIGGASEESYDFKTYPELAPEIFGRGTAEQIFQMWENMGRPKNFRIVEMGAGNGTWAKNILHYLKTEERFRELYESIKANKGYIILEISPQLIIRQENTLKESGGEVSPPVTWVRGSAIEAPFEGVEGVVISNELPDAFPVHKVKRDSNGRLKEVYVTYRDSKFEEELGEISDPRITEYISALIEIRGDSYVEAMLKQGGVAVNLGLVEWQKRLGSVFKRGYVLTIDYGSGENAIDKPEHPLRVYGADHQKAALRSYPDDFMYGFPGTVDITANVDFKLLASLGKMAGLEPAGILPQRTFFCNIIPRKVRNFNEDVELARNGSSFNVIIQGKGVPLDNLVGLTNSNITESKLPAVTAPEPAVAQTAPAPSAAPTMPEGFGLANDELTRMLVTKSFDEAVQSFAGTQFNKTTRTATSLFGVKEVTNEKDGTKEIVITTSHPGLRGYSAEVVLNRENFQFSRGNRIAPGKETPVMPSEITVSESADGREKYIIIASESSPVVTNITLMAADPVNGYTVTQERELVIENGGVAMLGTDTTGNERAFVTIAYPHDKNGYFVVATPTAQEALKFVYQYISILDGSAPDWRARLVMEKEGAFLVLDNPRQMGDEQRLPWHYIWTNLAEILSDDAIRENFGAEFLSRRHDITDVDIFDALKRRGSLDIRRTGHWEQFLSPTAIIEVNLTNPYKNERKKMSEAGYEDIRGVNLHIHPVNRRGLYLNLMEELAMDKSRQQFVDDNMEDILALPSAEDIEGWINDYENWQPGNPIDRALAGVVSHKLKKDQAAGEVYFENNASVTFFQIPDNPIERNIWLKSAKDLVSYEESLDKLDITNNQMAQLQSYFTTFVEQTNKHRLKTEMVPSATKSTGDYGFKGVVSEEAARALAEKAVLTGNIVSLPDIVQSMVESQMGPEISASGKRRYAMPTIYGLAELIGMDAIRYNLNGEETIVVSLELADMLRTGEVAAATQLIEIIRLITHEYMAGWENYQAAVMSSEEDRIVYIDDQGNEIFDIDKWRENNPDKEVHLEPLGHVLARQMERVIAANAFNGLSLRVARPSEATRRRIEELKDNIKRVLPNLNSDKQTLRNEAVELVRANASGYVNGKWISFTADQLAGARYDTERDMVVIGDEVWMGTMGGNTGATYVGGIKIGPTRVTLLESLHEGRHANQPTNLGRSAEGEINAYFGSLSDLIIRARAGDKMAMVEVEQLAIPKDDREKELLAQVELRDTEKTAIYFESQRIFSRVAFGSEYAGEREESGVTTEQIRQICTIIYYALIKDAALYETNKFTDQLAALTADNFIKNNLTRLSEEEYEGLVKEMAEQRVREAQEFRTVGKVSTTDYGYERQGKGAVLSPIEHTASPQISRRGFIKALVGGAAVVAAGPVIFKIYKALKSSAPQKALTKPIAELVDELLNRNNIDYETISNSQPYAAEAFPINRQRDFKTYQPGEPERARKFLTQVVERGIKTNPEFFLSLLSQIKHVVLLENSPHSTGSGFAVSSVRSVVLEFEKEIPTLNDKAIDDFTELLVHEMSHNYGENNRNIKIAIPGTVLKNKDIILGPDAENNTGISVKGIFSEIYARCAEICWENTAKNRPQSWMNEEQYMIDVLLSAIMRSDKKQNVAIENVSAEQEAVNIWSYYWATGKERSEATRLVNCAQVALWSYGYDANTLKYKPSLLMPTTERDENNTEFLGYRLTFITSENKPVEIFAGIDTNGNIKINGEKGWQEFKFKQVSLSTGRHIDRSNEGVGADSLAGLLPVTVPYMLTTIPAQTTVKTTGERSPTEMLPTVPASIEGPNIMADLISLTEAPKIDRMALVRKMKDITKTEDIRKILKAIDNLPEGQRAELEMTLRMAISIEGLTEAEPGRLNVVAQVAPLGGRSGADSADRMAENKLGRDYNGVAGKSIIREGITNVAEFGDLIAATLAAMNSGQDPRGLFIIPVKSKEVFEEAAKMAGIHDNPNIRVQYVDQGDMPDLFTQFLLGIEILEHVRKGPGATASPALLRLLTVMVKGMEINGKTIEGDIDPIVILDSLFKGVLTIRKIDWKSFGEQRKSWEAVATAL